MTKLEAIKARWEKSTDPDEFIEPDTMVVKELIVEVEHSRADIPQLLAVVEAAHAYESLPQYNQDGVHKAYDRMRKALAELAKPEQ